MVPSDLVSDYPKIGEVWWLEDMIVLVYDITDRDVTGLVLLDLDEVFDPGEEFEFKWYLEKGQAMIQDAELTEQNRRIA